MRTGRYIGIFALGLSCSCALGQGVDRDTLTTDSAAVAAVPISASPVAPTLTPLALQDRHAPPPGFPAQRSLYEYTLPPSPETTCLQVQEPMIAEVQQNVFEHLDFHPAAIRSAFTHENLVKMAHNFVPGNLPDAPSYTPLTNRQKFDRFLRSTHSSDTIFGAVFDSLISQASGAYPQFGGGMEGYGKRYGVALAGAEAGSFFGQFLFPTLLHQDPRYFPSHQNDISNRLAYAASRVLITRSNDGHNVLNTSLIFSQLAQAALTNAYIPYRNESVGSTLELAATGLGGVAQDYILKEFWPDIKEFLTKHQPGQVRRLRQRWDDPSPALGGGTSTVAAADR